MRRGPGSPRRTAVLYAAALSFVGVLLVWWLVFFARQGELLVERLQSSGMQLQAAEETAVRDAANRNLRMLLAEGGALVLLAVGGLLLVLRTLRRELELHRQQRDFLSAVTHELRSPIAAARLQVESLRLGRVPEHKRERYLEHTLGDLDRLSRTVDQLLAAARASSGRAQLALEPLDLGRFTERVLERVRRSQVEGEAEVEIHATGPVQVQADPEALQAILENLLSNAAKYGGDPPRVDVSIERSGASGVIEVRDHGPGIPGIASARLFDPFVRGGDELVRERPGVGLGLYLVAELTRALGGEVRARNADGGGLAVRVTLPLAREAEEERGARATPAEGTT